MKKNRFVEEPTIGVLKQGETALKPADLCCELSREGKLERFVLSILHVERFRRGYINPPAYLGVP